MYWNNVAYVESALHIEGCYKSQFLDSLKWHLVYCYCRFKQKAFKWSIIGVIFIAVSTPATAGVWPGPPVQLWWLWWPGSDYVNTDPLSTGQGKLGPAPRHPGSSPVHWHGPRPGRCDVWWYVIPWHHGRTFIYWPVRLARCLAAWGAMLHISSTSSE